MAELFLELIVEEIPARMQAGAETRLAKMLREALAEHNLGGDTPKTLSSPRRLAVAIADIRAQQEAQNIEKRGPRVGANDKAIDGFAASLGVARDALETRETDKGAFYFANINQPAIATKKILPSIINTILESFTWAKSQRWGAGRARWVRPLHAINLIFDGEAVAGEFDLDGAVIAYGATSQGHRFLAPEAIALSDAKTYEANLQKHFVIADRNKRREVITAQMEKLAQKAGYKILPDDGLLDEVTGLVEYPHAIMGAIDKRFMTLPREILIQSMRHHQKYFALTDAKGRLAPAFITISNMAADAVRDKVIRTGNERVLRARLSDAEFLWEQDSKIALTTHTKKLDEMVYFEGLGTVADRVERISELAEDLAKALAIPLPEKLTVAAKLCKADLVTGTVGEFPKLQGIIGGHLARAEGAPPPIVNAIAEHYQPVDRDDALPQSPLGCVLALADKLEMLKSFFRIGKKPTGSGDPFGLRRAALGVIRILDEKKFDLDLAPFLGEAQDELLPFLTDRFYVYYRDKGFAHDVLRTDKSTGFNILLRHRHIHATTKFLAGDDGKKFVQTWRRVHNILSQSEQDDYRKIKNLHFNNASEQKLFDAMKSQREELDKIASKQSKFMRKIKADFKMDSGIKKHLDAMKSQREELAEIASKQSKFMREINDRFKMDSGIKKHLDAINSQNAKLAEIASKQSKFMRKIKADFKMDPGIKKHLDVINSQNAKLAEIASKQSKFMREINDRFKMDSGIKKHLDTMKSQREELAEIASKQSKFMRKIKADFKMDPGIKKHLDVINSQNAKLAEIASKQSKFMREINDRFKMDSGIKKHLDAINSQNAKLAEIASKQSKFMRKIKADFKMDSGIKKHLDAMKSQREELAEIASKQSKFMREINDRFKMDSGIKKHLDAINSQNAKLAEIASKQSKFMRKIKADFKMDSGIKKHLDAIRSQNAKLAERHLKQFEIMSKMSVDIDRFFEAVKVNSDDAQERQRRLALLKQADDLMSKFADFSQLEGGTRGDDDDEMGL